MVGHYGSAVVVVKHLNKTRTRMYTCSSFCLKKVVFFLSQIVLVLYILNFSESDIFDEKLDMFSGNKKKY